MLGNVLRKKPLAAVAVEVAADRSRLKPTLGLFDLLCIGIGGTVGSGVFVICGLVVGSEAGTAGVLSWVVAGFASALSGLSYAELSGAIPSSGSAYGYAYVALGELPAVLVGWCLTLEYGLSGAAVARSWGDKVHLSLQETGHSIGEWGGLQPIAGAIMALAVLITACGVEASKRTVNAVCVLKVFLVLFMIVVSFSVWEPANAVPWAPFGLVGVARASTLCFFGYLGFDEVTLMSLEAKNPHRDVPLSLVGTIFVVTLLYATASVALSGVVPYTSIDESSAFSEAFESRGLIWAHRVVAVGEIATLPLVVLVSFLAQPRLQFSMAEDGLLPPIFSEVTKAGSILKGSLISGLICVIVATAVPFSQLGDAISAGVLVSFNCTNASLIAFRRRAQPADFDLEGIMTEDETMNGSARLARFLRHDAWKYFRLHRGGLDPSLRAILMNLVAFGCALLWRLSSSSLIILIAAIILGAFYILVCLSISLFCPPAPSPDPTAVFKVPLVPFIPSLATFINWILLVQLEWTSAFVLFAYLGVGTIHYFAYGLKHSVGGTTGWDVTSLEAMGDDDTHMALLQMQGHNSPVIGPLHDPGDEVPPQLNLHHRESFKKSAV